MKIKIDAIDFYKNNKDGQPNQDKFGVYTSVRIKSAQLKGDSYGKIRNANDPRNGWRAGDEVEVVPQEEVYNGKTYYSFRLPPKPRPETMEEIAWKDKIESQIKSINEKLDELSRVGVDEGIPF